MNKFLISILLLTAVSITSSERVARQYDDEVERGDKFIDDFIRNMTYENGHEYDPYILEDNAIGFWKKIVYVNFSGEAKLHNGYIIGLKSLHRADQCTLTEKDDGRLYVAANLGAGVLNCHYDGTVKFMNFGPTISIYGEIQYVETYMEFSINAKTGRDGELEKFNIYDLKGMSVSITGLGPMNWAANYLISSITSMFNGFIRRIIEKQIRKHIEARLPNYQFPVHGSDNDGSETPLPEVVIPDTYSPDIVESPQKEEAGLFARKLLPTHEFRL